MSDGQKARSQIPVTAGSGNVFALMSIDQPKASALLNGRLSNFSSERLMRVLTALGRDVDITVRATPRSRAHGHIRVIGEEYA